MHKPGQKGLLTPVTEPGFQGWIGLARRDITPPVGIYARNWGAASHDAAEGIHRPLTATVLTIQDKPQGRPCVLVILDLGWYRCREDEWAIRGPLVEELNLDPARVMVALAHTHSGPARAPGEEPGADLFPPYIRQVGQQVKEAVEEALRSACPAVLTWATGRCDLARNRDLPDPQSDRYVCGFNPNASADDTLLVGRVTDENGTILAVLANYACHPTTLAWLNRLISPDYIGALRETVEGHIEGAMLLFMQGASGELGPREGYEADPEFADAHGRQLGYAVLSTLEGMLPPATALTYDGVVASGAPLATWKRVPHKPPTDLAAVRTEIDFPVNEPCLPKTEQLIRGLERTQDRLQRELLNRKLGIRKHIGEGSSVTVPLYLWRVGDAFFVGVPGEAYSFIQMELRRRLAPRPVIWMNMVNAPAIGYFPTSDAYDRDIYQVNFSPYGCGCLEKMLETAERVLREL